MASKKQLAIEDDEGTPKVGNPYDHANLMKSTRSNRETPRETPKTTKSGSPSGSKREVGTLKDLQKCGVYVYFLTFTYGMMVFSQTINLIFMTFADRKPTVEYHCNQTSPDMERTCDKVDCWYMVDGEKQLCNKTYSYDFGSIREEFEINPTHVKFGTALQNVGLLFGAVVFGNLADAIGRRWVLISASVGLALAELASSFANNFWLFTFLRFVVNFFNGGKHCTCSPYLMENLPDKSRMWVATLVTYSPMYILMAGVAKLCGEWRMLARVSAAITIIPLVLLIFVEETPRWLIQKGREGDAEKAVVRMKGWDGKIPDDLRESIHSVVESESDREKEKKANAPPKYNSLSVFKSKTLTKYAVVFSVSLFSASFVSYGIAFNMDALAGTVYINVIILGASRYAINILAVLVERISTKVGRRMLHIGAISFIVVVIAAVMVVFIFKNDELKAYAISKREGKEGETMMEALYQFNRIAALLGAAMCTEIFVLNAVQPPELFPTPIRAGSNALIQIFNRLGTICSPLLFRPGDLWPPAPYFMMTATSLLDLILYSMWIPETRGKPMPDKMPDDLRGAPKDFANAESAVSMSKGSMSTARKPGPDTIRKNGDEENSSETGAESIAE